MKTQTNKPLRIAYIATTGLIAFSYAAAGLAYLSRAPDIVAGFAHLGYPAYFLGLLGAWKLAGAIAVALPRLGFLNEWAYAGMVFNLTAAVYSHLASGDPASTATAPLGLLALVVASRVLKSRVEAPSSANAAGHHEPAMALSARG